MKGLGEVARRRALACVLLAAAVFFAAFFTQFYPIQNWLFWRYLGYWFGATVWAGACFCFGHRVLARVLSGTLRKSEQLMLAAPVGAFAFGLAIFFIGLAHGLNVVTFFALPAAFIAVGAKGVLRDVRRWRRRARLAGPPRVSAWTLPPLAFAVIAIGLVYIQTMHPLGFTFDARWYHMTIAQRYALSGKIWPFPEGYWNAAWPHLFSYQYTWVFLAPLPMIFDRLELCAHLEVMAFLMTLAQVPVVVRRLLPNTRVGLSWIVFLLFPGIYLYDGNLNGGADHFAAFFALPIALTFWRAYRDFRAANVAVFAFLAAAAFMTKYTAMPLALVPSTVLLGRGLWLGVRRHDKDALRALGALVGVAVAFTAPNWLANIIWYGDPVYPMLHKYLHSHPYVADTASELGFLHGTSRPGKLTPMGIAEALGATVTFSFLPNDWYNFHRDVPVFGSLFTLTIPCLPFLRGARRIVWLYAMATVAIFLWYLISHYDRYLQDSLPWMVTATACTLILIWRLGGWVRFAVVPLVALQIIWGGDTPFIATHNQVGDSPLRNTARFLESGYEQQHGRLRVFEPMPTLGEAVPKDAVLLAHETILILGTDRNWVSDLHQSRISYGLLVNPKAIDDMLKALGVTHLAWPGTSVFARDTLAGDLAFLNYAVNDTVEQRSVAGYTVAKLPPQTPADARDDYDVAYFSCGGPYVSGLYHLSQLRLPGIEPPPAPSPLARLPDKAEDAVAHADFVVLDRRCHPDVHPAAPLRRVSARGESELWVRARQ
ncbi:MAG TPA: hypothetical protein VLA14_13320 [Polyangia bacterium]|jgi:hypothetical protein|nr:hypothetical protein [Polyangia bacterium]